MRRATWNCRALPSRTELPYRHNIPATDPIFLPPSNGPAFRTRQRRLHCSSMIRMRQKETGSIGFSSIFLPVQPHFQRTFEKPEPSPTEHGKGSTILAKSATEDRPRSKDHIGIPPDSLLSTLSCS